MLLLLEEFLLSRILCHVSLSSLSQLIVFLAVSYRSGNLKDCYENPNLPSQSRLRLEVCHTLRDHLKSLYNPGLGRVHPCDVVNVKI